MLYSLSLLHTQYISFSSCFCLSPLSHLQHMPHTHMHMCCSMCAAAYVPNNSNLQPHQMWVTKWLWFFVKTKTILEVFNRFSLSIFTYCYCWSIFKRKRRAELCKIAAHLVKWDITFQSFLLLDLCCDELCSQCKQIWGGVSMVKWEGWYLLSCARKLWVLWWAWACVPPTHSALPEQGKVDRRESNDSDRMVICLTKLPLGLTECLLKSDGGTFSQNKKCVYRPGNMEMQNGYMWKSSRFITGVWRSLGVWLGELQSMGQMGSHKPRKTP